MLGPAGPACAHATLIATDPAEGAVLESAPDRIRFTFDESVAGVPDGVRVFDAQGDPVASSAAVDGSRLDVTLTEQVGDGTLVVVWRVVSGDGHPISGSLSFSIGAPSADVTPPPIDRSGADPAPWMLSVMRWVGYLGLFLAVGLVVFTVLFLPRSSPADRARRLLVITARAGAATTVVGWLAALPLTGAYQLGGGASSLGKSATWSALSAVEYAVPAVVVAGVVLAVGLLGRGLPSRRRGVGALAAGVVAACAPAVTGHTRAATPEALAVTADMLHVMAGSVWLGGLVGLALVLPDLSGRGAMAAEVLARFSAVAASVLVALAATGVVLAWRIVGSWSALVETGYGTLLLAKVAVALVAVLIAGWNRYALLPRVQEANHRRDRRVGARTVVRAITGEATALVAVLLVTGLLVDRSPEREVSVAPAAARTSVKTAMLGDIEVSAKVSPLVPGANTITLELRDPTGGLTEGLEIPRVRISSDQVDLGAVPARFAGRGTYRAEVVLPSSGTWKMQISLRISKFESPVTSLEFAVG